MRLRLQEIPALRLVRVGQPERVALCRKVPVLNLLAVPLRPVATWLQTHQLLALQAVMSRLVQALPLEVQVQAPGLALVQALLQEAQRRQRPEVLQLEGRRPVEPQRVVRLAVLLPPGVRPVQLLLHL